MRSSHVDLLYVCMHRCVISEPQQRLFLARRQEAISGTRTCHVTFEQARTSPNMQGTHTEPPCTIEAGAEGSLERLKC